MLDRYHYIISCTDGLHNTADASVDVVTTRSVSISHLKPLVESATGTQRRAFAFLCAEKAAA